jgi:hypothetical protein
MRTTGEWAEAKIDVKNNINMINSHQQETQP